MNITDLIQEPCAILLDDSKTSIGYTSGGVSFSLESEIIENTPDQSYTVSDIIQSNYVATVSIPYAEYDFDKLKEVCPYLSVEDNVMNLPTYYKFENYTKLTLLFDAYLFEFPYTIPIISIERNYNSDDVRITNIEFKIISKDNFFNLSKYYHIFYEVQVNGEKYILVDENNQYIEEEEWLQKQ